MKPTSSIHQVYFNSAYLGVHLQDVELPEQCYLLGLIRSNQVLTLADNPKVEEEDWLVAVALNDALMPELDLTLHQSLPPN